MFSAKDLFFAKGPAGGYTIAKSLRFRSSASAYLSRTPGSAGNRQTWTWSGWVKRGLLTSTSKGLFSAVSGSETMDIVFEGSAGAAADTLRFVYYNGTALNGNIISTPVYRDPSAWYHIVAVWNTTDATAANRMRLYVNGIEITAFGTAAYPTQNTSALINNTVAHAIGRYSSTTNYYDGYLSEVNFIDGQALDPTYFGQTDTATGVWMPKKYTGSYGTNGFYLNFSDASAATAAAIGKDSSGNGNNWTPNNISVTAGVTYDSMVDTPTNYDNGGNGAGNYAVLNPLDKSTSLSPTNANLTWAWASASHQGVRGTFSPTSGLYYFEAVVSSATGASVACGAGLANSTYSLTVFIGSAAGAWGLYSAASSNLYANGVQLGSAGAGFSAGDVLQTAWDVTNSRVWFGKNNVWYDSTYGTTGNPSTGSNPTATSLPLGLFPFVECYAETVDVNFGQRPFTYTPPTGFKALCTQNLPTPTIGATSSTLANKYMDVSLYTGTGSAMSVTNAGSFQPDFLWIKQRNGIATHVLANVITGVSKYLFSNLTNAEATATAGTGITAFNSGGFSLGTETSTSGSVNAAGGTGTYVAWQWKADGSGSSNTSGSITSTVSANVTAGFSVVTFTVPNSAAPQTFGHGLGVAPGLVILKYRSTTSQWFVYHKSLPSTYVLLLNSTAAQNTTGTYITAVSSSTVSLGSGLVPDATTPTAVAYCFAEVAGYSRFGSYTGNGSADGPFVYCGFRPRYILTKRTDTTGNWEIYDTSRDTYNVMSADLSAESSAAETSTARFDALSNGFKIRTTGAATNASGGTYIFAVFAETPFNYARAR